MTRRPVRIQLQRTAGWRKPPGAVVVARGPGRRWGGPFAIGQRHGAFNTVVDRAHAVALYRDWLATRPDLAAAARVQLAGQDLACWCPPDRPCHADVLLELANSERRPMTTAATDVAAPRVEAVQSLGGQVTRS